MMLEIALVRFRSSDQGTFGVLVLPDGGQYNTLELPWRDNKVSMSCIPEGTYEVGTYKSPRRGLVYILKAVPGRSAILIHSGNFAGDKTKGYHTHSEGCILLGKREGVIDEQEAVLVSRPAVREFMEYTDGRDFILHIESLV